MPDAEANSYAAATLRTDAEAGTKGEASQGRKRCHTRLLAAFQQPGASHFHAAQLDRPNPGSVGHAKPQASPIMHKGQSGYAELVLRRASRP